jgi:hypothetical protein
VVAPFLIRFEIPFQQIRKKEELQDGEHDEQFNQDDAPQFPAPGHVPEALNVEPENFFHHRC